MLKRRTADRLTVFLVYFSALAATFVVLTPIDMSAVDPNRLDLGPCLLAAVEHIRPRDARRRSSPLSVAIQQAR
jgi:hypothetical protein